MNMEVWYRGFVVTNILFRYWIQTQMNLFVCIQIRINLCIQQERHHGTIIVVIALIVVNLWSHKTKTENVPWIIGPVGPPVPRQKMVLINATLQLKTTGSKKLIPFCYKNLLKGSWWLGQIWLFNIVLYIFHLVWFIYKMKIVERKNKLKQNDEKLSKFLIYLVWEKYNRKSDSGIFFFICLVE